MPGMHKELKLIQGVPILPGLPVDTLLEKGFVRVLDFLSGSAEGFALNADTGGWDPQLPSPKTGLWMDVPFADGRTPYAGANQNVTETMRLVLTAPSHLAVSQWLSQLALFEKDCDRFWQDEGNQYQPVYIHWWAEGAPAPQYALVMSIDTAVSVPSTNDDSPVLRDVVLTIEREPYWTALPPGSNPILWKLYAEGKLPGLNYDYESDFRLFMARASGQDVALVGVQSTATPPNGVRNATEFTVQSLTTITVSGYGSFLTIPAADIPGDVPPLVCLGTVIQRGVGDGDVYRVMAATTSQQQTAEVVGGIGSGNGDESRFYGTLPGIAAQRIAGSARAADTGGIAGYDVDTAAVVAASRIEITPGGLGTYIRWTRGVNLNVQRGRYAAFLACRQNSGSAGDIEVRLAIGYEANGGGITTPLVDAPLLAGVGATSRFPLLYLGQVKFPPDFELNMDSYGTGLNPTLASASTTAGYIDLQVRRNTGAALLYVSDLILMPIDEGFMLVEPASGAVSADVCIIDSTRYLSHGKPGTVAQLIQESIFTPNLGTINGTDLILQPGVENTIFLCYYNENRYSNRQGGFREVAVNIIPRWRGIRDV